MSWSQLSMPVHAALAQFPGVPYAEALQSLMIGVEEDFGCVSIDHIQINPQNRGRMTPDTLDQLVSMSPGSQFRFHANVHIDGHSPRDLEASYAQSGPARQYFHSLKELNDSVGSPAYTLHAGERSACGSLGELFSNVHMIEDILSCPVGVEGHYPDENKFWIQDWEEYAVLLHSDVRYALDLSHLNVVARKTGRAELGLTRELVSSDRCIEVHLSHNNGRSDAHVALEGFIPWWVSALDAIHPQCVVFTEGVQNRGPNSKRRAERGLDWVPEIVLAGERG